ncbi:MAG: arginine--tRNA ligase [Oscillospiraceae bacterium]|nr:arginine--tRNA ligase [Oscillospiraceae bacterium]
MNHTYFDPVADAKNSARALITAAVEAAQHVDELPQAEIPAFTIEIPADTKNGDLAANIALVGAKAFRLPPRRIAEVIASRLDLSKSLFERAEVAGPGFLNLFLSPAYFGGVIKGALAAGESYGRTGLGEGKKVMVEFVSANPTGPMHLGNARGGALGDCLAACLDWAGYTVSREFYINDAGNQIEKFGKSLSARYLQHFKGEDAVSFPPDGYQGEDIKLHAQNFAALYGDKYLSADEETRKKALVDYALPLNIQAMKDAMEKYRIHYDEWFCESALHDSGAVQEVLDKLKALGATYEKDGAVWYKAAEYSLKWGANQKPKGAGEDEGPKDEVLIRANGVPTYFAADVAYHYNKLVTRGFDLAIDVWGADHAGHVPRMKGAMDAVGLSGSRLDVVLMQLVKLVKDGQEVRMSKRTGKAVSLVDLLDEVPIDSARFFFNQREPGAQVLFDLDLAVKKDSDNPVYYVQYAHARICSMLKKLAEEGVVPAAPDTIEDALLAHPAERELIRQIARLPGEIAGAAQHYDPARVTRYAIDLATLFHKFYNACRVKGEEESLLQARLALCMATRNVLRNVLDMLKITAPESM